MSFVFNPIDPAFLARERREMSENLFSQEYGAVFGTGAVGGVLFTPEMIDSMFTKEESTP